MNEKEKFCPYQEITDRILEKLDQGIIPWKHYLKSRAGSLPVNALTGKGYRGVNHWLLQCSSFSSNVWASYKQFQQKGLQVKAGEKGTRIVFWKIFEKKNVESKKVEHFPMLRLSTVFNVSQTEGYEEKIENESIPFNPIEKAETLLSQFPLGFPVAMYEKRGYACYRPSTDEIVLPVKSDFVSENEYYNTYFHEAVHATGHTSRLSRFDGAQSHLFASQSYSKEELVAELGASFLSSFSGILGRTFDNSVAYISEWASRLRRDKKLIIQASSQAQKAVDYLTNVKFESEEQ